MNRLFAETVNGNTYAAEITSKISKEHAKFFLIDGETIAENNCNCVQVQHALNRPHK